MNNKIMLIAFALQKRMFISAIITVCCTCINYQVLCQTDNSYSIKTEDIIASVHMDNLHFAIANQTAGRFHEQNKRLADELLKVFRSSSSSNLNQGMSAYYLGEMRAPTAADDLAAKITLKLDKSHTIDVSLPIIPDYPAMDALIKIGNPSIPAVIRNLAESDDAKVRELSLQVLTRVDGDKDISQLRLQKALKAETDSVKQARLQLALKSLAEAQFNK